MIFHNEGHMTCCSTFTSGRRHFQEDVFVSQLLGGELHGYHGSHTDHECSLRRREDCRQSEKGVFSAKNLP